jgi:hypothetical protein
MEIFFLSCPLTLHNLLQGSLLSVVNWDQKNVIWSKPLMSVESLPIRNNISVGYWGLDWCAQCFYYVNHSQKLLLWVGEREKMQTHEQLKLFSDWEICWLWMWLSRVWGIFTCSFPENWPLMCRELCITETGNREPLHVLYSTVLSVMYVLSLLFRLTLELRK